MRDDSEGEPPVATPFWRRPPGPVVLSASTILALGLLLGAVWSPCVGPTLGAASVLAAQGKDLGQVALIMLAFGVGAALPLLLLGMLSRETLLRWRTRLADAGKGGKIVLGVLLIAVGLAVASGFDKRLETAALDALPAWFTEISTRY